jgi:hypothetical protein
MRTNRKFALGCLVILCLCLVPFLWLSEDVPKIPNRIQAWIRSFDIPTVQVRYQGVLDQITNATQDVVLLKADDRVLSNEGDQFPNCISGGMERLYATNRPYTDVLADYSAVFPESEGWEHQNDFFRSKTAQIIILQDNRFNHPENYQTFYEISFAYAEPAIRDCFG